MNITECWEGKSKKPPNTIREIGFDWVLGRKIIEYSGHLGSYGMGGPGFAGFKLDKKGDRNAEWLVLTLWGSDNWMLFNGRWLSAHPNQYDIQKPLIGFGDQVWDEFTSQIVGSKFIDADFSESYTKLTVQKDGTDSVLEIPENTKLLSKYGGNMKYREWKDEDQREAWVISRDGNLQC